MVCSASTQPNPSARVPHIIHQSTRFRPKMCLWRVSSLYLIPWGNYPPKSLIFWTSMGISSLNVYARISAQKKRIITLDGSKCASRQDTKCAIRKLGNGVISGVKFTLLSNNSHAPMSISSQNTMLNK